MYEMGVSAELLAQILEGRKTVEGRLRTGKFLVMRKGDKVSLREDAWHNDQLVQSESHKATIMIEESLFFDSFADMLDTIDFRDAIPNAASKAEALQTYRRFYTEAQEQESGVVALRFSVLQSPLDAAGESTALQS